MSKYRSVDRYNLLVDQERIMLDELYQLRQRLTEARAGLYDDVPEGEALRFERDGLVSERVS